MVSVLDGQLNLQLNSVLLDYTPWRKTVFLVLNGSYYHSSEKALDDKSKLVIVTTVMIHTRSYLEFQNVCSVLLPIDQRIIACRGLYTLIDNECVLAYFFLFESFCCFFPIILSLHGPSRLTDAFRYEETFSFIGDDLSSVSFSLCTCDFNPSFLIIFDR